MRNMIKKQCETAFYNVSFSPDKMGKRYYDGVIENITFIKKLIDDNCKNEYHEKIKDELLERLTNGYLKTVTAYLLSQSRCASSAITGGSGFNVARAEKRNDVCHNLEGLTYKYMDNVEKRIIKAFKKSIPLDIQKVTELDKYKAELKDMLKMHDIMKLANKQYRQGGFEAVDCLTDDQLSRARTAIDNGWSKTLFSLSRVKINQVEARIKLLERKQELSKENGGNNDQVFKLVTIRNNYIEDRLQLLFKDKPSDSMRKLLKSHGYRWSPKNTAWQRKLTPNAVYNLNNYLSQEEEFKELIR